MKKKGAQDCKQLAKAIGSPMRRPFEFFDALVGYGFLEKDAEEKYDLTHMSRTYFDKTNQEKYCGLFLQFSCMPMYPLNDALTGLIKEPRPWALNEEIETGQYYKQIPYDKFKMIMPSLIVPNCVALPQLPEFKTAKTVLDIGGAMGYFMRAVFREHKHLKGVITDLPEFEHDTPEFLKQNKLDKRIQFQVNDFFTDELP